jgi:AraC-like DNA-binding protein
MDVLTDVLETLRFRSTLYCRVEIGAPWGLAFAPTPVVSFHVIERGSCWLWLDGGERAIPLSGGDLIVLTNGAGHRISDMPETPPIVTIQLGQDAPHEPERRCYAGTGGTTTLHCGLFDINPQRGYPLLTMLPPVIHVQGAGGRAVPWLDTTLHFLASEVAADRLGRELVLRRLTDMLFIQVVRTWAESSAGQSTGWLAALRDQQIGAALMLIHRAPEQPWSVAALADEVHMSRSAFAARFAQLVGDPPLRYLRRWRIQKAIDLLQQRERRVSEVAVAVGYESDVAFSQAFKREVGHSPQDYRRQILSVNGR